MKDSLLDSASEIKGIGQEMDGHKGFEIEDMADEIVDFAEEEIESLCLPITSAR